jgi:hypothetical protein
MSSVITLATRKGIAFPLTLTAPGGGGYAITSTPSTVPLATAYNDQGTFYTIPAGQNIVYNGKTVQLASAIVNGATSLSLTASPSVTIFNADVAGTATTTQINPASALGFSNNTLSQYTTTANASQCLSFPASSVMQGFTNYATIIVMDFLISNKGTIFQALTLGYEIHTNQGDTSIENLEAKMASYSPTFNSIALNYINQIPPNCIFIRWPFSTTRLRVHSIAAKRF